TRNIFGWQKPCYLLGEGYARTFSELMETTEWDSYGTGAYEKCANCMAHCGYEPTAADLAFKKPLTALKIALFGVKTEGEMAPDTARATWRRAQSVCERQGQKTLPRLKAERAQRGAQRVAQDAAAKAAAAREPVHLTAAE